MLLLCYSGQQDAQSILDCSQSLPPVSPSSYFCDQIQRSCKRMDVMMMRSRTRYEFAIGSLAGALVTICIRVFIGVAGLTFFQKSRVIVLSWLVRAFVGLGDGGSLIISSALAHCIGS